MNRYTCSPQRWHTNVIGTRHGLDGFTGLVQGSRDIDKSCLGPAAPGTGHDLQDFHDGIFNRRSTTSLCRRGSRRRGGFHRLVFC